MIQLLQMLLFVGVGAVIAAIAGIHDVETAPWYMLTISSLLAIGLYASTYGIVLAEARHHARIIFSAITVGVLLKALLIGGSMALIFGDPFYLILGVVVAQIDPLSVSTLMKGNRLSKKAKTILASWASFDDPMTVILALYMPAVVASLTGTEWRSITDATTANAGFIAYAFELAKNIGFAGSIFLVWLLIKRYVKDTYSIAATLSVFCIYTLLAFTLSLSVYYFWMLSVALAGLFLRPSIDKLIEHATTWALRLATILLGCLLIDGVTLLPGVLLGLTTYGSQIIVGTLLTRSLEKRDRVHIAFAQQNGITAIILSLLFEAVYPGTVSIVAPAIVTINILHYCANKYIDKKILHETTA